MLKTILGHWKSHRKKPSLLPEDGDVHFEDPSKTNPLFEDSDSSASSIKQPQRDYPEKQKQTERETCEQSFDKNNLPVVNELVDVSVPTSSSEITQSKSSILKDSVTIPEKDSVLIASNTTTETENLNNDISADIEHDGANLIPFESSEKETTNISVEDEIEVIPANTEENMRILHQPSPSAIFNANKRSGNQVSGRNKESPQTVSSLPTEVRNEEKYENNEKKLSKIKTEILKSNDTQSTSHLSQNKKENLSRSFEPSNDHFEKPAKLKAKAIDELIKKFQGPAANDNKVINNSHRPDKIDLISVSEENNKTINNVAKIEQKDSQISRSTEKQEASNKNGPEKEALSNIFKFPPPPPLEKKESSLHGRLLPSASKPSTSKISPSINATNNRDSTKESVLGKTRSDSSLDRTRTASSEKQEVNAEKATPERQTETSIKISEASFQESFLHSSNFKRNNLVKTPPLVLNDKDAKKLNDAPAQSKSEKEDKSQDPVLENTSITLPDAKSRESEQIVFNDNVTTDSKYVTEKTEKFKKIVPLNKFQSVLSKDNVLTKTESPILDPKVEASTSFSKANDTQPKKELDVQDKKLKSSISKGSVRINLNTESENVKSHSEDSGITRGDQISSEATQDASPSNPPEETKSVTNSVKKNKKEKKLKSISKKHSKNCKRHDDSISLKRGQCGEYYDVLTGVRHAHRNKHSDSWTSDLSWEERELLRRLRSRRGTVRSNTPSTRSRHSRHRFVDENYFRRPHNFRRSFSDESTFLGSSLCSCDECWAQYMKGYERASLRGMPPVHQLCTCHVPRNAYLGRRVQFRSEPIPEVPLSEKTTRTTTPAPTTDDKQEDEDAEDAEDEKSSEKSSQMKDSDSVRKNSNGGKDKKAKFSEEAYRIMTPWELEEWNYLMKKQLLQRRRRRARCMGIMALAMVVFVGLVVTILMVYLRRKVI